MATLTAINDKNGVPLTQTTDVAAMQKRIAELEAQVSAGNNGTIHFKVSEKGCVCMIGLGRFPVSLYASQWERLAKALPALQAFIDANADKVSRTKKAA